MGSNSYPVFEYCSNLKTLNIGNEVKTIPSYAFYSCSGLTSVTIPNSVTSIGSSAFDGCSGLTSVTIPNSVTSIGSWAFEECSGLTSVIIGNSVTSIGYAAFYDCTSLTEVNISDLSAWYKIDFDSLQSNPLWYAGKLKLNGTEIKDLEIHNDITEIKQYAFSGCTGLTSATIGNSVTWIGDGAFRNCTGLTSATIGNSVTSIGSNAFYGCSGLTDLTITDSNNPLSVGKNYNPSSVYYNGLFYDCPLENLYLGRNLIYSLRKEDGYSPFYNIKSLNKITIGDLVTEIGEYLFDYTGWYRSQDNGILYLDNCCLGYKGDKPYGRLTIKEDTRLIGVNAFNDCSNITSIIIPTTTKQINAGAFKGNSSIKTIVSLNPVPPTCDSTAFEIFTPTLYVQKNSFAQYFIHDYWGKYSNLKKIEVPVTEITFDNTYIELELGKSSTIKVSISPDNATIPNLIWESSNPSIVSINQSGSITAKSVGTATITVKANDGSNTSASCEVKVYSHNVESISLSNYEAVMAINDKITLTYTISPTYVTNNSVTWKTSNSKVAKITVNSDKTATVTAIADGEADITIKADDGSGVYASCKIIVTSIAYSISLSQSEANLPVNDIMTLTYSIFPTNIENKTVTWTTDNPNVAAFKENKDGSITIVGVSDGIATITATTNDGSNISASCVVTVGVGGIESVEADNNAVEVARYDIHGRLLSEPAPGINIVKYSDGTTRKEIVK